MPVSDSRSLAVALRDEIHALLSPLIAAAQQPDGIRTLVESLGRPAEIGASAELREQLKRISSLAENIVKLDPNKLDSWDGLSKALALSTDAFAAIRGLDRLQFDSSLAEQGKNLGFDLLEHLLALHLRSNHSTLFRIGTVLTLISPSESGAAQIASPRVPDEFHFDRVDDLLTRPQAVLTAHYFPNDLATAKDAHEGASRLFPLLISLANALGLSSFTDLARAIPELSATPAPQGGDGDHPSSPFRESAEDLPPQEPIDITTYFETFLPRVVFLLPGQISNGVQASPRFGVAASMSSVKHQSAVAGLIFAVIGEFGWSEERNGWRIAFESNGQVPAFVLGPGGVSQPPLAALSAATARFLVERIASAGTPAFLIGAATGTRLEVGAVRLATELQLSSKESDIRLSADAKSGLLVIAPGDGDGFIQKLLPADGLKCAFDLGVELSSRHGLRLRGSAGLDATLPIGLSLGGVVIQSVHLALQAKDSHLLTEVSTTIGATLGPIDFVLDRIGIAGDVTFPDEGGNLGLADLDLHFKAPSGAGLAIKAVAVSGAGFLTFDKGQYSGFVQLTIRETLTITAIGIITTRLPNGAKGFSLLVLITAEGFKPVPLPLGFFLTGIGGLLAINRTFAEEPLRSGLKNHTLDSVMFPRDPVRNAAQILSNLNQVFPAAEGHYLFGPMLQIAWGNPPLITAELAVVLEFGARLRLLLLAQIAAILPRRENDLVRLQLDAIGVVDFEQGTVALDATLYDSRLLKKFVLTGDMALRLKWESPRNFALAVGGLHHAFNPPANFPKLERISINLSSGDNPKFRCEAYFAITSNTLQFGARAELFASAHGFSIHGEVGFDVLIQRDPFHFIADFHAQVQLKRGKTNLFKVKVEGTLTGPRPLHIKGKATFEVLWWDVSISFNKTLVQGEKPPLPEPVDVLLLLQEALRNPASWTGELPAGRGQMVVLGDQSGVSNQVRLHPLGRLSVKQNVVPLNTKISRFGPATPAGADHFTIKATNLGDSEEAVTDFFAPAQFFEMTDNEKLSSPSFEPMPAGITFGTAKFTLPGSRLEAAKIEYETIIIDKELGVRRSDINETAKPKYQLVRALFEKQFRFGAAGVSQLRRAGEVKGAGKYRVVRQGWTIVDTKNLTEEVVAGVVAGQVPTYTEAVRALDEIKRSDPPRARLLKVARPSDVH